MAIAGQRIGRFKRFIIRCIVGFFRGIKNVVLWVSRGGRRTPRIRDPDIDMDMITDDKEFQVSTIIRYVDCSC